MRLTIYGVILIALGIFYLKNQNIYRRGIWMKTSLAIRFLSEKNYQRYMKALGVLFIIAGICMIFWEQAKHMCLFHH